MRWVVVIGCVVAATPAFAEARPSERVTSYVTDGGAVPALWLPLAGTLALDPDIVRRWDTSSVIATGAGITLAGGMLAASDGSAPYHVKGLAESAVTSAALTSAFDAAVGKRSSGTSGVFAVGTYGALYLHGHVLRGTRPAWQIAAYTSIGVAAMGIAAVSALHDGRDWTDVAIGGLLGTTTSTLFYLYQEGRFGARERSLKIAPTFTGGIPALSVVGTF